MEPTDCIKLFISKLNVLPINVYGASVLNYDKRNIAAVFELPRKSLSNRDSLASPMTTRTMIILIQTIKMKFLKILVVTLI